MKTLVLDPNEVPFLDDYNAQAPSPLRIEGPDRRGAKGPPEISVFTICFNAAETISATIDSIAQQTGLDRMEYIVVDGGSTDGTLDILRERGDVIDYWISEPDRGISDAFNKGVAQTTAPIVAHLNADDTLSPRHLAAALEVLKDNPDAGFCHGDRRMITPSGELRRLTKGPDDYRTNIDRYMTVNHPTMVVRREMYSQFGLFRHELRYAMDYDLVWRFAKNGIRGVYSSELQADMRDDGVSNTRWRETLKDLQAIQILNDVPRWRVALRAYVASLRIQVRDALETRGLTGVAEAIRRVVNIGSNK
jgi:glycosyltransferase involved in cell wall biosynthesis